MNHRINVHYLIANLVVNCFQFFNFKDESQGLEINQSKYNVVNCFQFFNFKDESQEYNYDENVSLVVNCFQFFNFKDESQAWSNRHKRKSRCELLSVL